MTLCQFFKTLRKLFECRKLAELESSFGQNCFLKDELEQAKIYLFLKLESGLLLRTRSALVITSDSSHISFSAPFKVWF